MNCFLNRNANGLRYHSYDLSKEALSKNSRLTSCGQLIKWYRTSLQFSQITVVVLFIKLSKGNHRNHVFPIKFSALFYIRVFHQTRLLDNIQIKNKINFQTLSVQIF